MPAQAQFDLAEYLRAEEPIIALVGATNEAGKYGNIILRNMMHKGYTMLPVNPRATTVEGLPAFHTLSDAAKQHKIGLVVFVVPPKITLEVLHEADALGLRKVWVQPGAGDDTVREFLQAHEFSYLIDACVMVETL